MTDNHNDEIKNSEIVSESERNTEEKIKERKKGSVSGIKR